MNHDWLLFLIMAHLLMVEGKRKLDKRERGSAMDGAFALICLVTGVLHLFGGIHD